MQKKITDIKMLFRLNTLSIHYADDEYDNYPFNYLQKKAQNESAIVGFRLSSDNEILLEFENGQSFLVQKS